MTVSPRRTLLAVAGVLACAVSGVVVSTPAHAAAGEAFTAYSRVISGDITGDGVPDHITLGVVGDPRAEHCSAQVARGLGSGTFATPTVFPLAMRGGTLCPDLGVIVRGPSPAFNQLAVTFFEYAPLNQAYLVQLFGFVGGAFVPRGHFQGDYQPSQIGSRDLDGDGWGDLWESTDQGSGFTAFVGRNNSWRTLYQTPFTQGVDQQFFDLNRAGGTDVLVTWTESGEGSGAAVVDGRTGATQVLGSVAFGSDQDPTSFGLSVIDIDHNAFPDLLLTTTPFSGPPTVTKFLNRSQGGRWYFQQLAP